MGGSDAGHRVTVLVGSGGVGKTTLAAALGVASAREGADTLVMTFDPSLRLKDALGVGESARDREVRVPVDAPGALHASLLDAKRTFDRLVARYSQDPEAERRILKNRFYRHLSGSLAGVLEYMAVERLYEVVTEGRHDHIILDTPPTRQALDFLEAPARIVGFLDSGALRIALRPWFDAEGRLRPVAGLGPLGRGVEGLLDRLVGLDLLREMAEFFQTFAPLFEGFRKRALDVERLLRRETTRFVQVTGPGEERIPDTLFFARRLAEAGCHLGPLVVNRIHPEPAGGWWRRGEPGSGRRLLAWLAESDRRGLERLRGLIRTGEEPVPIAMMEDEPADLETLAELARAVERVPGLLPAGAG